MRNMIRIFVPLWLGVETVTSTTIEMHCLTPDSPFVFTPLIVDGSVSIDRFDLCELQPLTAYEVSDCHRASSFV
jgi:hypothetical protein